MDRAEEPEEYVKFAEINSFKQFMIDDALPAGLHVRELTDTGMLRALKEAGVQRKVVQRHKMMAAEQGSALNALML